MPSSDRKLHEGDRRALVGKATDRNDKGQLQPRAHQFQPAIARKVEMLAAIGNSQEAIAFACDMHVETLVKHYREELEKGLMNANARVGASILQTALGEREDCGECDGTGGTEDAVCEKCAGTGEGRNWKREPNTTAQIWWSKNRMGWTDKERIEHVGDGGGPVLTKQVSSAATIKDRLKAIEERLNPPANDKAA